MTATTDAQPARATVRPPIKGTLAGREEDMAGHSEKALSDYWGTPCGRCESRNTATQQYSTGLEYWCITCGTELKSDGEPKFPVAAGRKIGEHA